MKTYQEMVQWVVDNNTKLRYHEWPAIMAISEAYSTPYESVAADVQTIKIHRERTQKEQRQAQSRASNEQRRLANLARKQGVEE
jgi:hypothetical protein